MHASRPLSRLGQFLMGLAFGGIGLFLVLGGLGLAGGGFPQEPWITILAGLVFLLPGAGIMAGSFIRPSAAMETPAAAGADDVHGVIRSVESPRSVLVTWVVTIIVILFVSLFWGLLFFGRGGSGNMPDWMKFVFPGVFSLVALVLIAYALWLTYGTLRFGKLALVLCEPPVAGGHVAGSLDLPAGLAPPAVKIRLRCFSHDVEDLRNRFGEERHKGDPLAAYRTAARILKPAWEASGSIRGEAQGSRRRYTFHIAIPDHLPGANWSGYGHVELPRDMPRTGALCRWELKVTADLPGPDLSRTFEIPLRAAERRRGAAADPAALPEARVKAMRTVALAELQKGTGPEDIADRFAGLGIPAGATRDIFKGLIGEVASPHSAAISSYLAQAGREPAVEKTSRPRTWTGPKVQLAAGDALSHRRGMGAFLLLWGAAFTAFPVFFITVGKFQPALLAFIAIGVAAVGWGIYWLGQRRQLWLVPERGCIEEHRGFARLRHAADHVVQAFDRVLVKTRWIVGSKRSRRCHDVGLAGPEDGRVEPVTLSSHGGVAAALAAAARAAVALRMDLDDEISRDVPVRFRPEQLAPLLIEQTGLAGVLAFLGGHRGFDLRRYREMVDAAPAAGGAQRRPSRRLGLALQLGVTAAVAVAVVGGNFAGLRDLLFGGGAREQRREEQRVREVQLRGAMRERFPGYDILPDAGDVSAGYVAGRGVRAAASGADLVLTIDEVRLEKQEDQPRAEYKSLGISLYGTRNGRAVNLGAAWNSEVRGSLTAAAPVESLAGQQFVVPGAASTCAAEPCRVRLLLAVQTAGNATRTINSEFAQVTMAYGQQVALPEPAPSRYWDSYYDRAAAAKQGKRYAEAENLFREARVFIERELGADHPAMARTLVTQAHLHELRKQTREYERALIEAYRILDSYADADVQAALRENRYFVDKETVARKLGDFYWNERDYAQGFTWYERAYRAAPAVQTTEYSRNLKLASSSAGMMVTACMLGDWDTADRAMAELKRRIQDVEPASQERLEYWIRTGEPRLKRRKC